MQDGRGWRDRQLLQAAVCPALVVALSMVMTARGERGGGYEPGEKIHPALTVRLAGSEEPVKAWVFFGDKGLTAQEARRGVGTLQAIT